MARAPSAYVDLRATSGGRRWRARRRRCASSTRCCAGPLRRAATRPRRGRRRRKGLASGAPTWALRDDEKSRCRCRRHSRRGARRSGRTRARAAHLRRRRAVRRGRADADDPLRSRCRRRRRPTARRAPPPPPPQIVHEEDCDDTLTRPLLLEELARYRDVALKLDADVHVEIEYDTQEGDFEQGDTTERHITNTVVLRMDARARAGGGDRRRRRWVPAAPADPGKEEPSLVCKRREGPLPPAAVLARRGAAPPCTRRARRRAASGRCRGTAAPGPGGTSTRCRCRART